MTMPTRKWNDMGMMSTYTQTISVENGIMGKPLKIKLQEDGILIQDEPDKCKYTFNPDKSGVKGQTWPEFIGNSCFSEKGNTMACTFKMQDGDTDYLDRQIEGLKALSLLYPDIKFHLHSSYCPGGCGARVTALDIYIKDGEDLSVSYLLNIKVCAGSDESEDMDTGLYVLTTPLAVSYDEIEDAFVQANRLCDPLSDDGEVIDFPVTYDDGLNLDTLLKGVSAYKGGWNFRKVSERTPISAAAYYEIEQWQ